MWKKSFWINLKLSRGSWTSLTRGHAISLGTCTGRCYAVICKVSVSAAHTDESLRGEMPWQQIPPTGREKRPCRVWEILFFETVSSFLSHWGLQCWTWCCWKGVMKRLEWILCCLGVPFFPNVPACRVQLCSSVVWNGPFGTMCHAVFLLKQSFSLWRISACHSVLQTLLFSFPL